MTIVVGSKVKNRSGNIFSNGQYVVTVEKIEPKDGYDKIWFKETKTWTTSRVLELADTPAPVVAKKQPVIVPNAVKMPIKKKALLQPVPDDGVW